MALIVDEVSVLHDAHWLGQQNLDLCTEPGESAHDIAKRLCDAGLLEISVVGRILEKVSYRLTRKGEAQAAECYRVVEADRNELRLRVLSALASTN